MIQWEGPCLAYEMNHDLSHWKDHRRQGRIVCLRDWRTAAAQVDKLFLNVFGAIFTGREGTGLRSRSTHLVLRSSQTQSLAFRVQRVSAGR